MKASCSNNRGFSLLEVLVALLFIGLLFQPVSSALLMSASTSKQYRSKLTSLAEMQAQMETTLADLSADRWHPEHGWESGEAPVDDEEGTEEGTEVMLTLLYQELSLVVVSVHTIEAGPVGLAPLRTIRHTGLPPWRQEKRTLVPVS